MRRSALLFSLLAVAGLAQATPVRYDLDAKHTQVRFGWSHFGFSHQEGRFDQVDAQFQFDAADPTKSTLAVTIPVASLDTGVPALDEHLKSPDFFDAAKFPQITFKSTKIKKAGKAFKVTGDLTMHGVTKPVTLDVELSNAIANPWGKQVRGVKVKGKLNRQDFGVAFSKTLETGGLLVGDEITLNIKLELNK